MHHCLPSVIRSSTPPTTPAVCPSFLRLLPPSPLSFFQVFFAVFFTFNFLFELLLSKNRLAFVMSIPGIVDIVTIVPVLLALQTDPVTKSPTGFVRLYRVLMLARVRTGIQVNACFPPRIMYCFVRL